MADSRVRTPNVSHEEQVEDLLKEIREYNAQRSRELRSRHPKRVYTSSPRKADIADRIDDQLRAALEDEIVEARSYDSTNGIDPSEVERETIKKALVGLKAKRLRAVARAAHVDAAGGLEEIADRVGRHYRWNDGEIARLILQSDREPRADRSYIERYYPLLEAPNLDYVDSRLSYVRGRYIRVGLARWFVFYNHDRRDDHISVNGAMWSYEPNVTEGEDDPGVVPVGRKERPVQVQIYEDTVLRVRHGRASESAAALRAMEIAARLSPAGAVIPKLPDLGAGAVVGFAPQSLFLLDVIRERLRTEGFTSLNLTVARFRMERNVSDQEPARPQLHAVRLEGHHILDSPPVCRLLAVEGRALVGVSLLLTSPRRDDGETGQFPVHVSIERDHALIMTGYGLAPPLAADTHSRVTSAVYEEITQGVAAPQELAQFARQIADRAASTDVVREADLLADSGPDVDDGYDPASGLPQ